MYEEFNNWFRGDKKKTLVLNEGLISIFIKHKAFGIDRLEANLVFDDSEILHFYFKLEDTPEPVKIFDEMLEMINQYIDLQNCIINGLKRFTNNSN